MVDDVLTSAKTKYEFLEKIDWFKKTNNREDIEVVGLGIAFDREQNNLKGRSAIRDFTEETEIPVDAIVGANEAIKYLYESEIPLLINGVFQPMRRPMYRGFMSYMEETGTQSQ